MAPLITVLQQAVSPGARIQRATHKDSQRHELRRDVGNTESRWWLWSWQPGPVFLLVTAAAGLLTMPGTMGSPEDKDEELVQPVLELARGNQTTRLSLDAFGFHLLLELQADHGFLAPGFTLQTMGSIPRPQVLYSETVGDLERCFYSGIVNRDPHSSAALSLCDGVHGIFYLQGEAFFIQPSPTNDTEPFDPLESQEVQPQQLSFHLLQRRQQGGGPGGGRGEGLECIVGEYSSDSDPDVRDEWHQWHYKDWEDDEEPTGTESRRNKRFVSRPHFVETMLMADRSMVDFYGVGLNRYLLTLFSVASRLYKHPSIQHSINLVLVKIVIIYNEWEGPIITSNNELTYEDFCDWQRYHNPRGDQHPDHYDTAVLLTRQDQCDSRGCNVLGLSDVGKMCRRGDSCSILKDHGLRTAYTMVHELGHLFNMPHDNTKMCADLNGDNVYSHLMSPIRDKMDLSPSWSPCSVDKLTTFLNEGYGQCLLDPPQNPLKVPSDFPGTLYDVDKQCQFAFGADSKHCPDAATTCQSLWCTTIFSNIVICKKKNIPWADGTSCGNKKWCISGQCVSKTESKPFRTPVNGRWGPWGPWGDCSRTCGGGIRYKMRECDNPVPKNGGKYCVGKRVRYRSCNTEECPDNNGTTFREEQCQAHNGTWQLFFKNGSAVEWTAKYTAISSVNRCKLICEVKGLNYSYILEHKVVDGTLCSPDSTSVCMQGRCVRAGCDRVIDSNKQFDECGVCGGYGSTCEQIMESVTSTGPGYHDVVTIPTEATTIEVEQQNQRGSTNNGTFLAIKAADGTYVLNGNFTLSTSEKNFMYKGTFLRYSGSLAKVEKIVSPGPLKEPLTIQTLTLGNPPPSDIDYTYFVKRNETF